MEFKGTKGFWFNSGLEIISMPSQVKISKISGSDYEEAKANALLISKAPEMLEILIETFEWLHNDQGYSVTNPYLKQMEQLIEEATKLKK